MPIMETILDSGYPANIANFNVDTSDFNMYEGSIDKASPSEVLKNQEFIFKQIIAQELPESGNLSVVGDISDF